MSPERFNFEGELLTVSEVMKRVPALGEKATRTGLRAGRLTTMALLNYDGAAAVRANGRVAAKRARATGNELRVRTRRAGN